MKPRFYSKEGIAVLTILSPILGCILFSYNLKEIGKGRFSPYFIIGGILWVLLTRKLVAGITDPLFQFLFAGITGCLVMNFFIWDRFLGNYPDYEKKPVWKPTLLFISICIALVLFQLLATRK